MNSTDRNPGPPSRPPTQAAEGLPRWRWTLDEFERFIELGIFSEADRVELIGGELVPMSPKGARHDNLRIFLQLALQRRVGERIAVLVEMGWRPDGAQYIEPDIVVAPLTSNPVQTPATDVLLLIEVADSSLSYDLKVKSGVYAALGVGEYWVVDARRLVTHVHRIPSAGGYASVATVEAGGELTADRIPGLTLRLADLGIQPA
jgi:Uma2 family endonuclease